MKWYTERPTKSGWALVSYKVRGEWYPSTGAYHAKAGGWLLERFPELGHVPNEYVRWTPIDLPDCGFDLGLLEAP